MPDDAHTTDPAQTGGEQLAAVVHVSSAPDMETYARIYNEGYADAVAQGLADDPTLASDWLAEQKATAVREALGEVARRINGRAYEAGLTTTAEAYANVLQDVRALAAAAGEGGERRG